MHHSSGVDIWQWQEELEDKLGIPAAVWSTQKKCWLDSERRSLTQRGDPELVAKCPWRIGIVSSSSTAMTRANAARVRSEWPDFNREAHRNGRRVPTRCGGSFEYCFLSGGFIQMKRLRIEFGCKPLNAFLADRNFAAFETHPQR